MRDESQAKKTFRDALSRARPDSMSWTNTDAFKHGLPDFFIACSGKTIAVEAKFIKELPKKGSSKALAHELSLSQIQFLTRFQDTGNKSVVLIGLRDVFAYTTKFQNNYTKDEILLMPRVVKDDFTSDWDLSGFLSEILK